ncbi:MAG: hypothetical protein PUP92_22125, partial [Rhizonema sp. PD38]|nr:hypothetical protein [Rhizonema sp. PD38]
IDPSDKNEETYSHRIFELLLRASTEFETNCKAILRANGYSKSTNLNITDYCKIEQATKLSNYKVHLKNWEPSPKVIEPFKDWQNNQPLNWYQEYNAAKHDRNKAFKKANMKNMLEAIAGLLCILYAQFTSHIGNLSLYSDEENQIIVSEHWLDGIIFAIEPYTDWSEYERYDFDWKTLKQTNNPFEQFKF